MNPSRLELDHLRRSPRPAGLSWLLLAIALGFAADVGRSYVKARHVVDTATERLARVSSESRERGRASRIQPLSQAEFAAARETILRLSTPWENVFRALEGARSDDVALLSVEPDAASGSLSITAEAKSYPAALTYVAWLVHEQSLSNVRLVRHEISRNDPRQPVTFSVSADWKEKR